ncbi:MAG: N-acetylmuramoyl-L-alanine amidase [Bacteroidia bacterium]
MKKIIILTSFLLSVHFLFYAQVIVIDPGHGYDSGGGNPDGRTATEIETALEVGLRLNTLITDGCSNWTSHMTRTIPNGWISLSQRSSMSNSWNADYFLSIHCNGGGGTGTETFWCSNNDPNTAPDIAFANQIQADMSNMGQWVDRRCVEDASYIFHLAVLSGSSATGCLSEIGFADHTGDAAKLNSPSWRDTFAAAYLQTFNTIIGNCSSTPVVRPVNDTCLNATVLTSNSTCVTVSGDLDNASASGLAKPTCDGFASPSLKDVWYKFTATSPAHTITVTPSVDMDPVVSIYNSCTSGEIECAENGGQGDAEVINATGLSIGSTYYVRVYDYGSIDPNTTTFDICITTQSIDNLAPTTTVSSTNSWQTGNFTASFSDADNTGGSGLEKSYYQVTDYNGTEWRANNNNGFFADSFNVAIHPEWTTSTGTWSINNAALYQSDESLSNTNIYATLNQTLSNRYLYNFNAKIDGSGTNKRLGFFFFSDNASLSNRGNTYLVWVRVDNSTLEIYKGTNDVLGLAQHQVPLTTVAGQWYDYKVIYDRITGKISIYRDNQLITAWTDASPIATGNAISFRSGNANVAIDELQVYRSRQPNTANITVGAANTNDIRYQNPNPTTPSGKIKSICSDSVGNLSSIFNYNLNIDWSVPDSISFVYDGLGNDITTTNSLTDLSANWMSSADQHSSIARYWYAIGTTPGADNVVNYTDNFSNLSVTADSLSLLNGQTYYVSVKAENGAGLESPVFISNGQTVQLVSVDELSVINSLVVYPNPFNNTATIAYQLNVASNVKVFITDVLGKELMLYNNPNQSAGKHQVVINAAELQLSKGMYFVKLETENSQRFVKIVVK